MEQAKTDTSASAPVEILGEQLAAPSPPSAPPAERTPPAHRFARWLTQHWFPLALGLACLANLSVVWSADWIPIQDWGSHVQHLDIVARQADPATVYPDLFQVNSLFTANGLELILARLLGPLFGALFVLKLVLAFYLVGTPLALVAIADAFGRPRWVALLGAPLVFNGAFAFGFVPFLSGIPLALYAIALARRFASTGQLRTGVALTVVLAMSFFAHAIAWLVAVSFALAILILFVPGPRQWRRFLPVPLSSPFVALWIWQRILQNVTPASGKAFMGPNGLEMHSLSLKQKLDMIPEWGLSFQAGNEGTLATIAIGFLWLMMLAVAARRPPATADAPTDPGWRAQLRPYALELLTLACVLGYFVLPNQLHQAAIISERWLVFAILLTPLWVRVPPSRNIRWALAVAVGVACWYPLTVARTARKYEREVVGHLPDAIAALPDRSSLLYIEWSPGAPHVTHNPQEHIPTGLHAVLNGGNTNMTFAGLPYGAADFRAGKAPAQFLHPRLLRQLPPLEAWDAVLIWSFTDPLGARRSSDLIATWQEGPWWLFGVVKAPFAGIAMAGGESASVGLSACGRNELLIGLDIAQAPQALRGVRAVCAVLRSEPLAVGELGPAHPAEWRGGRAQVDATLRCPEGQWVTAMRGRSDRFVQALGIRCSDGTLLDEVGEVAGTDFAFDCRGRRAAIGLKVRSGELVDAIGLACE